MARFFGQSVRRLSLAALIFLGACGGEPPVLPAAKPLTMEKAVAASIPYIKPGTHNIAPPVEQTLAADEKYSYALPLRLLLPEKGDSDDKAWPVIVFSHGNWSDADRYEPLLRFWVSHGYAVIAPTHLDGRSMARGIFNSLRYGQLGLIRARVEDVQRVLDSLLLGKRSQRRRRFVEDGGDANAPQLQIGVAALQLHELRLAVRSPVDRTVEGQHRPVRAHDRLQGLCLSVLVRETERRHDVANLGTELLDVR